MAQKEIVTQLLLREDDLGDKFSVVQEIIEKVLATRRKTINVLRQKGRIADRIHQGCAVSNRNANITGAFGGGFGILAGGITAASGGLAAPLVVATCMGVGAVCSVGGGAWSVSNEYDRGTRNSAVQKELKQQLAEDQEALGQMDEMFLGIQRGEFGEPSSIFRQLHTFLAGLGGIGMIYGSTAALDILRLALPPIAYLLSGATSAILVGMIQYLPLIAGKGALEGMEEVAEQSASSAVKFMYKGFSKDFVQRDALKAAQKAYKTILEETIENAAQEAAKKAAKKGGDIAAQQVARQAAKEAVDKAAKETATKAAREAASRAAQEGAKTAAKMTGLVTLGFGAFTSVWEGYNAYQNHYASQKESELGKELRLLADRMEDALKSIEEPIPKNSKKIQLDLL